MQDSEAAHHKAILGWMQAKIYEGRYLATGDESKNDPLETTKEVFVTFLAGTAILVGLVVFTYSLAIIFDRWCCCCPGYQNGQSRTATARRNASTSLASKAGLYSLSPKERRLVLEAVFEKTMYLEDSRRENEETVEQKAVDKDSETVLEEGLRVSEGGNENAQASELPDSVNEASQASETGDENIASIAENLANKDIPYDAEKDCQSSLVFGRCAPVLDDVDIENPYPDDKPDLNDADHERVCCICLSEYAHGCLILRANCQHMFHYDCCLEWLMKHDNCPYCRKEMMTAKQLRQNAMKVLGEKRVVEIGMWGGNRIDLRNRVFRQQAGDPNTVVTSHSTENVIPQIGDVGWP